MADCINNDIYLLFVKLCVKYSLTMTVYFEQAVGYFLLLKKDDGD